MRKTMRLVGYITGFALVFLALNILMQHGLRGLRLDATEGHLYTLSDNTKTMLAELSEPVEARLYYSHEVATGIPVIQAYAQRVQTLLERMKEASDGKLTVRVVNPEPFSVQEDDAVAAGIQGIPINDIGHRLYFGLLLTNSTDEQEVLAFLDPEQEATLEYELLQKLHTLSHPQKPVVGILSGWKASTNEDAANPLAGMMGGMEPFSLRGQMEALYEVRDVEMDTIAIPEEVTLLMVIHPAQLGEETLKAIDRFVVQGGRLLVFTDPQTDHPAAPKVSEMNRLTEAWGVRQVPGMVIADRNAAMRVPRQDYGMAGDGRLAFDMRMDYLKLDSDNMPSQSITTHGLQELHVITAGHWLPQEKTLTQHALTWNVLLESGEDAMELAPEKAARQKPLAGDFIPSGTRFALAGMVEGVFPPVFKDTPAPEQPVKTAVVLVADSDLLRDQFWLQKQSFFGQQVGIPTADNGRFVLNLMDMLTGNTGLMGLRSRTVAERPFEQIEAMRMQAEARFREQEEALQQRMKETEQRLQQLAPVDKTAQGELLTPEQEAELSHFREELLVIRRQLRDVQHALQEDISTVGRWLKIGHIGLLPLLVILLAFFLPRYLTRR